MGGFLILVVVCVALSGSLAWTAQDACHFVGARFARVGSSCDADGVCTGIRLDAYGRYCDTTESSSAVSCKEAQRDMEEFISRYGKEKRRSKRSRKNSGVAPELLEALEKFVIPALELVAFGSENCGWVKMHLFGFDERCLEIVSADPSGWREVTAPTLLKSAPVAELSRLCHRISHAYIQRPLSYATQRHLMQTAVQFCSDLSAVLGSGFLDFSWLERSRIALHESQPLYRPVDSRDRQGELSWTGVPEDSSRAVALASAVTHVSFADRKQLLLIYKLLAGWDHSPPTAAKWLMADLLWENVCYQLPWVLQKIAQKFPDVIFLSSLVDLCRPLLPMSELRKARDEIQRALKRPNEPGLTLTAGASGAEFFIDPDLPWSAGWSVSVPLHQRPALTCGLLTDFLTTRVEFADAIGGVSGKVWKIRNNSDATALGRAIGLSILNGVDLSPLSLNRSFVSFLHPLTRLGVMNLRAIQIEIEPSSTEQILAISSGIYSSLGPGGFEMFTLDEWMRIFGHS